MAVPRTAGAVRERDRGELGALLLVAAAVALSVVWLVAGGWRFHESWPFWADRGVGLLPLALYLFGTLWSSVWLPYRSKPAALRVRADPSDRAFVAPPQYLALAAQAAAQLTFAACWARLPLQTLEEGDGLASALYAALTFLLLAGVVAMSLLWVVAIFRDGIRLELRPEGLLVVTLLGRHVVPWEAVAVGPPPYTSRWKTSRIIIGRPELVRTSGLLRLYPQVLLPLPQLGVQHAFLTNVINHYLWHPEHRAAIGTPEEHERLVGRITFTE